MSDAAELLKVIKKSALEAVEASRPSRFFFGEVINVNPLKIKIEQKMRLGENQLVLSRNVTDFETEITVDTETEQEAAVHSHALDFSMQEAGDPLHTHNVSAGIEPADIPHAHKIRKRMAVTIHNGLAVGDKVILVQNKGGQQYLVLDRLR